MSEVDGPVKWVNNPGWTVFDEIFLRRAFGVSFFTDEGVMRVFLPD